MTPTTWAGDGTRHPASALRCRRRFRDDEVLQQHAPRLGLNRVRVNHEEVIAKEAFLLVPDSVGLQHRLPALRAGHNEGHGRRGVTRSRPGGERGDRYPTAPRTAF